MSDSPKMFLSSALCLAHELGHALMKLLGLSMPNYASYPKEIQELIFIMNEQLNTHENEKPIAIELGEGIRNDYFEGISALPARGPVPQEYGNQSPWWNNGKYWFEEWWIFKYRNINKQDYSNIGGD